MHMLTIMDKVTVRHRARTSMWLLSVSVAAHVACASVGLACPAQLALKLVREIVLCVIR